MGPSRAIRAAAAASFGRVNRLPSLVGLSAKPEEGLASAGAAFDEVAGDSLEPFRSRLGIVRYSHLKISGVVILPFCYFVV